MKLLKFLFMIPLVTSISVSHAADLIIAYGDKVSSMDPQLNNQAGNRSVSPHFYEGLTANYWDKPTYPFLAKEFNYLDDNTWLFKLRTDVKWQDGTPLTAEDVVYSFERVKHVPGSVASFAGYVRTVDSVKALDDHTVEIKTNIPNPNLPLDIISIYIVPKHLVEGATSADFDSGKVAIGTGPYKLVSYTPDERIIMAKNENYYGDKPIWDKVDYRYIPSAASRTAALLAGDVDVIDKVAVSDIKRLESNPKIAVYAYDGSRVLLALPNYQTTPNQYITDNNGQALQQNPLLDKRVREALSIAINREAISERILQGGASPANQWMIKNTFGYNEKLAPITYDLEKAKKLLAEAGYPEGFKITIHTPSDRYPQAPETAQAIAQFWSRIGVTTTVEVVPWAIYSGKAAKSEYAISLLGWGNGSGDSSYTITNVLATYNPDKGYGSYNWGRYHNPLVDEALTKATTTFDNHAREDILKEATQLVTDDFAILPIFYYKRIWASRADLKVVPMRSDATAAMMVTPVNP